MDQKPPETQQPSQSFLFAAIPVRHPVMWEKGTPKTAITLTRDATIHPKTQPGTSLGLPNLESASSSIRQRGHSNIMIANAVRGYPQKEHKILDLCQSMKVTEINFKSVFLTRKTKSCISVDLGCCSPSLNGTSECMSAGNKWCVHSRSDDVRIYLFYTESVLGAVLLCLAEACLVGSHQQQLRTHKHTHSKVCFWLWDCHCYLQRLAMFVWFWDNRNYFSLCSNFILECCMSFFSRFADIVFQSCVILSCCLRLGFCLCSYFLSHFVIASWVLWGLTDLHHTTSNIIRHLSTLGYNLAFCNSKVY